MAALSAILLTVMIFPPAVLALSDPFQTPPPYTGPPPGSATCILRLSTGTHYIAPNQVKAIVDETKSTCTTYQCDGDTGTATQDPSVPTICSPGCVDVDASVTSCRCRSDCTGQRNPCDSAPCQNGGTCIWFDNGYFSCLCATGYEGDTCQTDKCDDYCLNGGTCNRDATRATGVRCTCPPGYLDTRCETARCSHNPCHNGGVCEMDPSNDALGYRCQCRDGFTGPHCQEASCESGWSKSQGACYKFFNRRKTFGQAKTKCNSKMSSMLATAKTKEERDFVKDLAGEPVWIGGDKRNSTTWTWSDGTPVSAGYTAWKTGEPDGAYRSFSDVHCMLMNSGGRWMDFPCGKKRSFVCKYTLP